MTTIDQGSGKTARGNRDYPWDDFSPKEYFKKNYVKLRDDDRQIVGIVRDFLVDAFSDSPLPPGLRGVDVGTGTNLYPALTMLPFCEGITLYDHSAANIKWLEKQHKKRWPDWRRWPSWRKAWKNFWALLRVEAPYREISHPKDVLSERVEIVKGNVLEQPVRRPWDLGTMFFVAESITGDPTEFLKAVDHFFAMLKPRAPFAMAFMEHSTGYHVGTQKFPATDIGLDDVYACLHTRADNVKIHPVVGDKPLREGYTRMIVAHGRVKHVEEIP
jgi:hypothetical protein